MSKETDYAICRIPKELDDEVKKSVGKHRLKPETLKQGNVFLESKGTRLMADRSPVTLSVDVVDRYFA